MKMSTKDFCAKHNACAEGRDWALAVSEDMAVVWDAMVTESRHDWLLWTATRKGVFPDATLRLLACRFARETPLADGRTVWDLLTDPRSRAAIETAERCARGEATDAELAAAWYAAAATAGARDATAAGAAATDAARAEACAAARAAARDAAAAAAQAKAWAEARDAAWAAQLRMISDLGNPFN